MRGMCSINQYIERVLNVWEDRKCLQALQRMLVSFVAHNMVTDVFFVFFFTWSRGLWVQEFVFKNSKKGINFSTFSCQIWKLKQNLMKGWQYGKWLIYLGPIFQQTKLAFLRAREIGPLPYCQPCIHFCFNSRFKWRQALASLH